MSSLILVHPDGTKVKQLGISMNPCLLGEIPKGMVLSFHSMDYRGTPGVDGVFVIGTAMVEVHKVAHVSADCWGYAVEIEAANVYDFSAAFRELFKRLGKPVEHLTPQHMIHPSEQSFVRGVRNDIWNLIALLSNRWAGLRKRVGLQLAK